LLDKDAELKAFCPIAQEFKTNEATINTEYQAQGKSTRNRWLLPT
jgi:hypothetical protein